jgi:hypothetical protein
MKVVFIHYYFLININDIALLLEKITSPSIPKPTYKFKQNYIVLHAIKKHLTVIYLDSLLHVPRIGTNSGQVIV